MAADLTAGFGLTTSIPIPAIPTSFYPGLADHTLLFFVFRTQTDE